MQFNVIAGFWQVYEKIKASLFQEAFIVIHFVWFYWSNVSAFCGVALA